MRPKLPTNAIAYTILSLAGAGSFFVPAEALMPTTAAQTIPVEAIIDVSGDVSGEPVTAIVARDDVG
jgi:hypothetical protein